jgi:predicted O-methyltransferase YrrM
LPFARGASCVVEIGVYEGASALELCSVLRAPAELHLMDPFGEQPVDLVFVDGDHLEPGVRTDWPAWSPLVRRGGHVVFHDARLDKPGGRGLPGPTKVVDELFRGPGAVCGWEVVAEVDRCVAVRRTG